MFLWVSRSLDRLWEFEASARQQLDGLDFWSRSLVSSERQGRLITRRSDDERHFYSKRRTKRKSLSEKSHGAGRRN